jgi:hypothetical protein
MKRAITIAAAMAACLAVSQANAGAIEESAKASFAGGISAIEQGLTDKAASTRSLGSRATASTSLTVYGGFELQQQANVYILVRGNSLGTLGVTQAYLDRPRFRIFNSAGQDLVFDVAGRPGFNACLSSNSNDLFVINYYSARGAPVSSNDACLGGNFTAGAYTFTVTAATSANSGISSSPSQGEILFEVTLGP